MSGGIVLNVRTNFPAVINQLKEVSEQLGNKVVVRALNATVTQGKSTMARKISSEFRVSTAQAKYRLDIRKATSKAGAVRFEAVLSASNKNNKGRSMNMIAFAERSITLAQSRKRIKAGEGGAQTLRNGGVVTKALQLRFQIKRGGVKKVIKGAFIGNKGRTMFIRTGKGRLPIQALNTIDIPQMFNTKRINEVVRDELLKNFEKNFNREMRGVRKGFLK